MSPPCSDQEQQCSNAEAASSHALRGGLLADSGEIGVGLVFNVPHSSSLNLTIFNHLIFLGKSGLFFSFLQLQLAAVLTPSVFNHLASNFFYSVVISIYKRGIIIIFSSSPFLYNL